MAIYSFKARDNKGKLIKGHLEAEELKEAVEKLQHSQTYILDIYLSESSDLNVKIFSKNKIKLKDLAFFCRQLSFMLEGGIPLLTGLKVIKDSQASQDIKDLSAGLMKELSSGYSLTVACSRFPKKLPPLMVALLNVGEIGGFLDQVLEDLANYFDNQVEIMEKVKTALLYPVFVIIITILAFFIIINFIIPLFVKILEDMNILLPASTKFLFTLSLIVSKYWFLVLGILGLFLASLFYYCRTIKGKKYFDLMLIKIPLVRDIITKSIISRICRVTASLLNSGIPVLKALEVVEDVVGNTAYKFEINKIQRLVKNGQSLTESFNKSKLFPDIFLQIIAVGEKTGNLDKLLLKVSEHFDREINEITYRLPRLIEPIMMVFLGVIIGIVVMGTLWPLFSIISGIEV